MNITLQSIQLDAGMQNASGVVTIELAGAPVEVAFKGAALTILRSQSETGYVQLIAPAPAPKPKKPAKAKSAKASEADNQMSWTEAILQALAGGNLTSNELLDHVMRLRGVAVRAPADRKLEMSRLSVAASTVKKQGLIERVEENGIDKWRATKRPAI